VRWVDQHGTAITSRKIVARSDDRTDPFNSFEGNAQAVLAQTQSHQQVLLENFTAAMRYVVSESTRRQEAAWDKVTDLERELAELRAQNARLREEQVIEQAALEIREASESDPALEKAEKMFEFMATRWLAAKMAGAQKPPANDS
jgi:transposase-like protein